MLSKQPVAIAALMILSIHTFSQGIKTIRLKDEKIQYQLKTFHIAAVIDDRKDTNQIGSVRTGLTASKLQPLNLEGGAKNEVSRFIRQNLAQNDSTSPLVLHITTLQVEETGKSGIKSSNQLNMELALYHDGKEMVEFEGGGSAESTGDASKLIEELIRGSIAKIVEQFDEWWSRNKAFYIGQKKERTIHVEVTIDQDEEGNDFLSYSPKRPLTLDDFQGQPNNVRTVAAVTFSLVSLKYSSLLTMDNEIIVDVSVVAYFNKSKSWCRPESRSAETLAHEQRHFDLSAVKACELVDTIRNFHFSIDHFGSELDMLHRQKQRELDELQDSYDQESKHGTGPAVQQKWNQLIDAKLKQLNCFHN
jgi:hypothetical protein